MGKIRIFVLVKDSLYAVEDFKDPSKSAYEVIVNRWQDTEYLENYFERYKDDLQVFYPKMNVERAVRKTQMEMMLFDEKVFNAAKNKNLGKFVFKALHISDNHETYIDSKAYGPDKQSWLRLYALRLDVDIYIITGGGIKLTEAMITKELKKELDNLRKIKQTLIIQGLLSAEKGESGFLELKTN